MTSLLTNEEIEAHWQRVRRLCIYVRSSKKRASARAREKERERENEANERMNNLYLTMEERERTKKRLE